MPALRICLLFAVLILSGCATGPHDPRDPLEPLNRGVYRFNDTLDKALIKPVAQGYSAVMPEPGKMMVSSFFSNLDDITVAINSLLQFKVAQAISDSGRILVNSTVGLCGLADVASAIGMPKHNEDFGQTLGRWGIGSGPYLMLPFFGPSSVRDGVGLYADSRPRVMTRIDNVSQRNALYGTNLLNKRSMLLEHEGLLDEAAFDRYSFIRDSYLQRRESLVYDGNPPRPKFEDEEEEDAPAAKSPDSASTAVQTPLAEAPTANPSLAVAQTPETEQPKVLNFWFPQGKVH